MTDKDKIFDPESKEVKDSSQFAGNEELDEATRNSSDADATDYHYGTDTEARNPQIDEADEVSAPSAEGRRTREKISENPSKED